MRQKKDNSHDITFPTLEEVEAQAAATPEGKAIKKHLDNEEKFFAKALKTQLTDKQMTPEQLAAKVNVDALTIRLMLARQCRPQQKIVQAIAAAFGVDVKELWPNG